MKAAIVREAGKAPVYGDFEEPTAGPGEVLITVAAAALAPLTRMRAAGAHYSASGRLPAIPGVDGVGRLADGRRVYFLAPTPPFGSMAERAVARTDHTTPVPDALDDATAAAIGNPGMSSWAALTQRARLVAGETVLINGATGSAGGLAIQIARHLGAGKVIAAGREPDRLSLLKSLGADVTILLTPEPEPLRAALEEQFGADGGVNVVLDYVYGKSAEAIIAATSKAKNPATPIRFVQVGTMSGADITLPGAALRSTALELMGTGLGSVPLQTLVRGIGEMMQAAAKDKFRFEKQTYPLSQVNETWNKETLGRRVVYLVQ